MASISTSSLAVAMVLGLFFNWAFALHLNCSQSAFAKLLNVSTKTVQAWEQGSIK